MTNTGFECMDCGVVTSPWPDDDGNPGNYYMLRDELWRRVNPQVHGCLCVRCMEQRLGRVARNEDYDTTPAAMTLLFCRRVVKGTWND